MNYLDNGSKVIKQFWKGHLEVLKIVWFGLFIISFIFAFIENVDASWSNTTFNNSLATENLTFTGNQNITRYLSVPQNTYLTNARMNLSSNYISSLINMTTPTSATALTCPSDAPKMYDGNFSTFGSGCGSFPQIDTVAEVNYTYYTLQPNNISVLFKLLCFNENSDGAIYYLNYTNNTYVKLVNSSWACDGTINNIRLPIDGYSNNKTSFRLYGIDSNIGDYRNYYDTYISYYPIVNPINLNISINNKQIFYYLGLFNQTNNRTNNFASQVNSYLGTCSYSAGYCQVPVQFHSDTAGILQYSNMNFSSGTVIINQSYTNYTYETKYENFNLSVELTGDSELSQVKLVYNGVEYAVSDITTNGTLATLSKSINIPLNSNNFSNQTNQFYWKFTYDGGFTESLYNSTQVSGYINLQSCNSTYNQTSLNFTYYDELNQTNLNATLYPTSLLVNFKYWLGDGTVKKEYNYQALGTSNNSFRFCNFPNQTIKIDMDMQYLAINYADRSYYFRSKSINSTQQNILLYSILSSEATKFSTNVKQGTEAFSNAVVEVWKYFVGLGQYKLVMIGLTDDKGKFVTNIDLDQRYNLTVVRDGISYGSYVKQASCASAPCEIDINLDDTALNPYDEFYSYYAQNIDYTYDINYNTSIISINFTDKTGTAQYWRLWVYKAYESNDSITTICDTKSYASIGSLSCNYTGYYGDIKAKIYISRSPELLVDFLTLVNDTAPSVFSTSGLLASLIIILIIVLSGARNPVNVLILLPLGAVVMKFLGFLPLSWGWIVTFVIFDFWIITRLRT
jgi:hypothetical protein